MLRRSTRAGGYSAGAQRGCEPGAAPRSGPRIKAAGMAQALAEARHGRVSAQHAKERRPCIQSGPRPHRVQQGDGAPPDVQQHARRCRLPPPELCLQALVAQAQPAASRTFGRAHVGYGTSAGRARRVVRLSRVMPVAGELAVATAELSEPSRTHTRPGGDHPHQGPAATTPAAACGSDALPPGTPPAAPRCPSSGAISATPGETTGSSAMQLPAETRNHTPTVH